MKRLLLISPLLFFCCIYATAQTKTANGNPYLSITGGKTLKEGQVNLKKADRGSEHPVVTYDLNKDGKQETISYWISTSIGQQKIICSTGETLLEEADFLKSDMADIWISIVSTPTQPFPLIVVYYFGSDESVSSTLYIFKQKDKKYYLSFQQDLLAHYGFTDNIDFKNYKIQDAYGSQGLFEETDFKLK